MGFVGADDLKKYWTKIRDVIYEQRVVEMLIEQTDAKLLPSETQK
ncbi:MAG: hypothetical protein ACKVOU_15195 [Cytophagales bacterium]